MFQVYHIIQYLYALRQAQRQNLLLFLTTHLTPLPHLPSPPTSPCGDHQSAVCICEFVFVLFVHLLLSVVVLGLFCFVFYKWVDSYDFCPSPPDSHHLA